MRKYFLDILIRIVMITFLNILIRLAMIMTLIAWMLIIWMLMFL